MIFISLLRKYIVAFCFLFHSHISYCIFVLFFCDPDTSPGGPGSRTYERRTVKPNPPRPYARPETFAVSPFDNGVVDVDLPHGAPQVHILLDRAAGY